MKGLKQPYVCIIKCCVYPLHVIKSPQVPLVIMIYDNSVSGLKREFLRTKEIKQQFLVPDPNPFQFIFT